MGLELILGAASLAVGLVSGAKASSERKASAAASNEANQIRTAQSRVQASEQRRQLLREERLRRARMLQGAQNTGTAGSSGAIGGTSAITTNVDNLISSQLGETKSNEGINSWEQKAVNYENKARNTLMWGEIFQNGINTIGNIWE